MEWFTYELSETKYKCFTYFAFLSQNKTNKKEKYVTLENQLVGL